MWKNLLWLIPTVILLAAVAADYPDMRDSWNLGGPGARHAEDIALELRAAWDAP